MRAASRCIRAQWRAHANITPSWTRIVEKIPHPFMRPTCPGERTGIPGVAYLVVVKQERCMIFYSSPHYSGAFNEPLPAPMVAAP